MQRLSSLIVPFAGSMRNRAAIICALAMVTLFCAPCQKESSQNSPPEERPVEGGRLRVLSEPPGSLDPAAVDEVYEAAIVRQIYEGLLTLDAGLRLHPGLASSWTISPDEKVYTFHIRTGVSFHDGQPLTATDVAFTLQRCLSPDDDVDCLAQSYLAHIEGAVSYQEGHTSEIAGMRIIDDHTLQIELDEPLSIFLNVLAMDQTVILSAADFETKGAQGLEDHPNGCGPFRYVERQIDDGIVLARFDDYWRGASLIDTLIYQPIPESMGITDQEALSLGRVDLATLGREDTARAYRAGMPVYRSPELSLSFLGLRIDKPPLDIPEVRRAILLAVDRAGLQQLDPIGRVPVRGLLPPGMPGRDPVDRMPTRDIEEAAKLLVDAGHPGGEGLPPISIGIVGGGSVTTTTDLLLANIRETGLEIELVEMDWRQLDSLAVGGHLQAFLMSWIADLPDGNSFLYALFHSEGEANLFAYASDEVDALLETGRALPNGPERSQAYLDLQAAVLRDVPLIPLFHSSAAYGWRPEVRGLSIGPCGISVVDMTQVYFKTEPEQPLHGRVE